MGQIERGGERVLLPLEVQATGQQFVGLGYVVTVDLQVEGGGVGVAHFKFTPNHGDVFPEHQVSNFGIFERLDTETARIAVGFELGVEQIRLHRQLLGWLELDRGHIAVAGLFTTGLEDFKTVAHKHGGRAISSWQGVKVAIDNTGIQAAGGIEQIIGLALVVVLLKPGRGARLYQACITQSDAQLVIKQFLLERE